MARHRHRNPFAAGSINSLAVKVVGGFGGLLAASAVPAMVSPTLNTGWPGAGMAFGVAFLGAWLLNKMSVNASEGFLIGGAVQGASRVVTILTGRTLVSASLGQYGPLNFTIPTPAYQQQPAIAASASKTTPAKGGATASAASMGMLGPRRAFSKYVS
jgi:hypothetical protein